MRNFKISLCALVTTLFMALSLAKAPSTWAEPTQNQAMFTVGGGTETIIGSNTRLLVRMRFNGFDAHGDPSVRDRIMAISAEVGLSPGESGANALSRLRINLTPAAFDLEPSVRDTATATNALALPIVFERDTSIGLKERFQISVVGFEFKNSSLGAARPNEEALYSFFTVCAHFLGYSFAQGESTISHALNFMEVNASFGAGAQLGRGWSVELVAEGRGTGGGSSQSTNENSNFVVEGAGEVRVIFEDEPDFVRFKGFARVQARFAQVFSERQENNGDALSIIAGLEFGF